MQKMNEFQSMLGNTSTLTQTEILGNVWQSHHTLSTVLCSFLENVAVG